MLSLLYAVLIGLALVELALVGWTLNFLRKYAFRQNPDAVDYHAAHHWRQVYAGDATCRPDAANQEGDLFERYREAGRR